MCTKAQAITILEEIYKSYSAVLGNVCEAYLYGSYARGDFTDLSDVDILITANMSRDEISEHRMRLARITSELSLKHGVTVSVTVKPLEQFRKYAHILPYYKNVISEGIRYGA